MVNNKIIIFLRIIAFVLSIACVFLISTIIIILTHGDSFGIVISVIFAMVVNSILSYFFFLHPKYDEEAVEIFEQEVLNLKQRLSNEEETLVEIREDTEVEFGDFECKAKIDENGKIVCTVKIPEQLLTFNTYEEFANYFELPKNKKKSKK
ncbi:MAG: hypothetical protein IJ809_00115 [Clostridia bacterium]|nr:hypothetical protein [Clostridia bacterium]